MSRIIAPLVLLVGLVACGGSGPSGPGTPTVSSVTLAPNTATLAVGATQTLAATVKGSDGAVMASETITWSSSSPAVASVSGGVVTAVAPGQATIQASAGGKNGSALITVLGQPASITITRSGSWLLTGDTLQPRAVVRDAGGTILTNATVTWSVTGGATVASGTVTATTPGSVQLTATAGAASASATLTVWAGSGTREPLLSAIDSVVMAQMTRLGIPGGSVSITRNGRLVLSRAYGWADTAARRAAATTDLWRIGSTSKPITAVAVMKLVEGGQMTLTERPFAVLTGVDLLPGQTQDARLLDITVRQLMEHSGGWHTDRTVDQVVFAAMQADGNIDPKHLIRNGRGVPLAVSPGTQYAYTNYASLLLGRMIERASGKSYETYVKDAILTPLGISSMKLGRTPLGLRDAKEVAYYDHRGPVTALYGTGLWPDVGGGQEYAEASGQWIASSLDMVKFLNGIDGNALRPDILSSGSLTTMTTRNTALWSTADYYHGMGLFVQATAGGSTWLHTGGQDGGDAYIARRPDGTNIAVLFNLTRDATLSADAAISTVLGQISTWPVGVVF